MKIQFLALPAAPPQVLGPCTSRVVRPKANTGRFQGGVEIFVLGPQALVGQAHVFLAKGVQVGGLALAGAGTAVFQHAAHDAGRPFAVLGNALDVLVQIAQQRGIEADGAAAFFLQFGY